MPGDELVMIRRVISRAWLRLVLWLIVIPAPAAVSGSDGIRIGSATIFNTSCARCHEGECSERLSFDLPENAADDHIRRYAGVTSAEMVRELYGLLRHMKEECSFYPLPYALGRDRSWDADRLDQLKSPDDKAYFLPLGLLQPGSYRLLIEGNGDGGNYCVELISSRFEYIEYRRVDEGGAQTVWFQADEHTEYFLRITALQPITLERLELVPAATQQH